MTKYWNALFNRGTKEAKRAVDKTRIGPDRIGSDRTDKTPIGSDRIGLTKPGSDRIRLTKPGLQVGTFQIPIKYGQVVSLPIKMTRRDQESDCHCTVFAFSSPFCREDFLFIVMGLHSVNYFMKRIFFFQRERSKRNYEEERYRKRVPKHVPN